MAKKVDISGINEQSENSITDEGRRSKMRESNQTKQSDPKSAALSSNQGYVSHSENKIVGVCKRILKSLPYHEFDLDDIAEQFRINR